MVRAAWVGTPIVAVPVKCTYAPGKVGQSHFRPVRNLAHITTMNIGLVLQSWFVPQSLRAAWSRGEHKTFRATVHEIFTDHAQDPVRLSLAVGLGLFFGILPVWGLQTVLALTLAHRLRLNLAITLLACNISLPPMVPFLLYAETAVGHWLFTGELLTIALGEMTMARARESSGNGSWAACCWRSSSRGWGYLLPISSRGCFERDEARSLHPNVIYGWWRGGHWS